jgi:hypothetical protein
MISNPTDDAIIGAGPYGLSIPARVRAESAICSHLCRHRLRRASAGP